MAGRLDWKYTKAKEGKEERLVPFTHGKDTTYN